ncbi:hypothetical protein [Virgibacillus salexigens]|uniref:Uncharacterized protein n=1 Tax=Virgibacillus massiliensis TaxID=1462526 RepID=A0A024QH47_9BACI|nr:hypothetical protein [Virgibacillus massiliensis]CDQ41834.1 hypothetical protein BN990_04211 [Virgibacillus massiliensis]
MKRFMKGLAKEFNPKEPFIKKVDQRNLNNLWTGRTVGGKGKIAMGVSAVGFGGHQIYSAPYQRLENEAQMREPESLPGSRGDGLDYTPNYTGIEANGDLAFALHNLRHGG